MSAKPAAAADVTIDAMLAMLKRRRLLWELMIGTVNVGGFFSSVTLDGDKTPIAAQSLVGSVVRAARVAVIFVPPAGYYVAGYVGDPPGQATWLDYVPTTTNLTLGTGGSIVSRYKREGHTVDYRGRITLGTSGAFTGTLTVSLPVDSIDANFTGSAWAFGTTAAARQPAVATPSGLSNLAFYATGGVVNATVPFTWASGNVLVWSVRYEV